MFDTSFIEISADAIKNNIKFIRKLVGKNTDLCSVIKGNAYGHGVEPVVKILKDCEVKTFAVSSASEAYEVYKYIAPEDTLIIMGVVDGDALEWAIQNDIEIYVYDLSVLVKAIKISKKLSRLVKVHIEVETGLNRTGFKFKTLPRVIDLFQNNKNNLNFSGLCTHYAGAESISNYYRIVKQIQNYSESYNQFKKSGLIPGKRHTACSAATLSYPETRMDFVRIGILQYGYWPSSETFIGYLKENKLRKDPVKQALSWKTRIVNIKDVRKGEFIGYGNSYLARDNMKIGIIPVGYASGFSRSLSNQGRVLIKGHRVSVVGVVNMNMFAIDITNIKDINPGDEVVLIGVQDNLNITVSSFSEFSDQLNYELLTRLPAEIPRCIV